MWKPALAKASMLERPRAGLKFRIVRSGGHEHANTPHLLALLRARPERPGRRCATQKRDELAPSDESHHLIPPAGRFLGVALRGAMARPAAEFGPYTTCYNRFVRWRRAGVWAKIMNALAGAHECGLPLKATPWRPLHRRNDTIDGQHIGVRSGETLGPEFQSGAGRADLLRERSEPRLSPHLRALQNDLDVKEIVNL